MFPENIYQIKHKLSLILINICCLFEVHLSTDGFKKTKNTPDPILTLKEIINGGLADSWITSFLGIDKLSKSKIMNYVNFKQESNQKEN